MKGYKTTFASSTILILSFVVCRYVLFDFHGMKALPLWLLIIGGLAILIAACSKSKYVPFFTSLGYPISFVVGVVFQEDKINANGGTSNNMWFIWTIAFIFTIIVGSIFEIIKNKKSKQ